MDADTASSATTSLTPEHFDVLIVGAGISGIGGAYHLTQQCPGTSFLVLETRTTSLPWSTRRVFELQEKNGGTVVLMKEVRRTGNPYIRLAQRLGFRKSAVQRELSSLRGLAGK